MLDCVPAPFSMGEAAASNSFLKKRDPMKKFLAAGLLAICLIAASQQQASAWVNSRFGVGLNWNWSSGGNSLAWGAWQSGQPPGAESFGYFPSNGGQAYYMPQAQGSYDMPAYQQPTYQQPTYANPGVTYSPFQYATSPRIVYYYPAPYYYGR
jgi:hypothetical protein